MSTKVTPEEFLRHVEKHELNIIKDDGVHRHIELKDPNTTNRYFGLVTWPGHLCYYGDMGTYVFSRVRDMFTFFRHEGGVHATISYGYWAEKMEAVDTRQNFNDGGHGYKQYSADLFRQAINYDFRTFYDLDPDNQLNRDKTLSELITAKEYELEQAQNALKAAKDEGQDTDTEYCAVDDLEVELADLVSKRAIWDEVETDVLSRADDGYHHAVQAAVDFEHDGEHIFQEFYHSNLHALDYRFEWLCYALRWAVHKYDQHHASTPVLSGATHGS